MKTASLALIFLAIASLGQTEPPKEKPDPPSIQLFSDSKNAGKGLLVEVVAPAALPADREKTVFSYKISNLLEEEVFVELPSESSVSYYYEGPNGKGVAAGGGSRIIFPDNVNLLKRLHASSYKTSERFTCACATVTSKATAELPEFATAEGKLTVTIVIKGFYRSNGKSFIESIELPLPLKDK